MSEFIGETPRPHRADVEKSLWIVRKLATPI